MPRKPALPSPWSLPGTSPNEPRCGTWMVRWRRSTAEVPARIWWCPHEPGNADNLLEVPILAAEIAGEAVDPTTVWTMRKRPIDEAEYKFRVADQAWLKTAQPDDPKVNPRQKVDLSTMRPPYERAGR
jgi:hypothetical protein